MATQNLSDYDIKSVPNAQGMKFGIVVSEWNSEITEALFKGAFQTLIKHGVNENDIIKVYVPGTFELTFGAKLISQTHRPDAVIVLGCVVQGDTRHFDFICHGVTQGITELNVKSDIPIIFGILTTENYRQAEERAGGRLGNKGDEAAVTAIKMVALKKRNL